MDGTSLDDLDYSSAGTNDRDLVRDILHIANNTSGGGGSIPGPGGRPPLPVLSTRNPSGMQNLPPPSGNVMDMPNPNSFQQHSMDPGPYQAHVIGNSQPTPADFANLMQGSHYPGNGGMANLPPPIDSRYVQPSQQYIQQQPSYNAPNYPQQFGGSSWMSTIIKEAKIPLFVAILVFIVNLPIFNILISHSLPSLISVAGGLTSGGMVVKALMAGFLFWIVQRVLAPLVVE
jgi:hypothetical protein